MQETQTHTHTIQTEPSPLLPQLKQIPLKLRHVVLHYNTHPHSADALNGTKCFLLSKVLSSEL